jgi:tetratricopeptide (TPR) repeat protein
LSLLYNVQLNKLNVELAQAAEQKRLEAEKAENERARAERQEHEANRRREEADRLRTLAENQRRRAEENFRKAREAVKLMLTEVGQTELVNVPLMEDVRQRLLAKAVAFHTEFLEKQSKAPTPRQQAGQAYMQLGDIYRMLGQYAKAESAYQDGLARFDELTREFPQEPDYRRDLALGRFHQGELARARNRNADAQAAYETARQMQAKLVAGFPKNADYRADLAHTLNDLALVQRNAGQSTAARDLYRQAIEVQQQLVKEHPDDRPEFREDLAGSWNDLGTLLYRALKEPGEAEKAYRAALTEFAALAERYPTVAAYRRKMAAVSNNLGNVLADQHGPAAGEKLIREALSHRQQLSRDFPSVLAYRQELALTHQNLAALLATDKKFAEAEKECLLGLEMQRKLAADFPGVAEFQASLAGMLDNLAALHLNQDRLDKALEALKEAQTRHPNAGDGGPARLLLRKHHLTRADTLLRIAEKDAGKHTEAAASAAELARLGADSAEDQRLAGVILARCTALVARDTKLADAERKPLAENYARRAVEMLGRAVQLGWSNAVELRTAAVYVPLRSRADFQKLLAELDKKGDK